MKQQLASRIALAFIRASLVSVLPLALSSAASGPDTLGAVLQAHGLPVDAELSQDVARLITSYALLDSKQEFLIAYYIDDGSGTLKPPLHVVHYNRISHTWRRARIGKDEARVGDVECLGSITSIDASSAFFYVHTHLSPSAGCLLLINRDLAVHTSLYGWFLAAFGDGTVVYHRSQIHFASYHTAEISIYQPATRQDGKIYPRKPYQKIRLEQMQRVRALFTDDWCMRRNHPCDAELFDNYVRDGPDGVVVSDSENALAFVAVFDNAAYRLMREQPLSEDLSERLEVLYVYRNLTNGRPLEYRELLWSDFRKRFDNLSLHECLKPEIVKKIFAVDSQPTPPVLSSEF